MTYNPWEAICKCWSSDMRIAKWYENWKLIWKLQTHMKIANVHVGTIHWNMRIANWYENCKLIWKLQTDMKIAKQYSCFGIQFLRGRLRFSYETQREWKLVLEQKECFHLIVVWTTKPQQNNLSQNLPQFIFKYQFLWWHSLIHILRHDSSALQV